jgi:hypothetical protein
VLIVFQKKSVHAEKSGFETGFKEHIPPPEMITFFRGRFASRIACTISAENGYGFSFFPSVSYVRRLQDKVQLLHGGMVQVNIRFKDPNWAILSILYQKFANVGTMTGTLHREFTVKTYTGKFHGSAGNNRIPVKGIWTCCPVNAEISEWIVNSKQPEQRRTI